MKERTNVRFRMLLPVIVATSICHAGNPQGAWTSLAPYPIPITNNAVTSSCENGTCTIYSFMGMTTPTNPASVTAASYKMESPGTDWVQIADAPLLNGKAKIGASAVACGGGIYLIGGYTIGGPEVTEDRLFRYDPQLNQFVERSNAGLVEVDDTVAACYLGRYIYTVSGWHGPFNANVDNVQLYDTLTDTWQQATPVPTDGRFGHAGGIAGDRIVIIDGASDTGQFPIVHSTFVGRIDAKDLTVINWGQNAPSPFSQTYRAANAQTIPPCERIVFSGGTDNSYNFTGTGYNGQPSLPLDQVMTYDPLANAWILVATGGAHAPTMDHRGLVWFDGNWVTVGGMTGPGAATTAVSALGLPSICPGPGIPTVSSWGLVVMTLAVLVAAGLMHDRRARSTPD